MRAALAGQFEDPALKKFGTDYVIVNANEDPSWTIDQNALGQRPVIWSNAIWRVYKLS